MNGILVPGGTKVTGARGSSFGRLQRSQIETSRRVKVKAVKSVVRMPMAKVTAKPAPGRSRGRTARPRDQRRQVGVDDGAKARVKPGSIAWITERPLRRSSRMRS